VLGLEHMVAPVCGDHDDSAEHTVVIKRSTLSTVGAEL
jgi:hypothetical protein